MKRVLDTNVLISAIFLYGSSNEILKRAENKEFEIILSSEIIEELINVLGYEEIKQKIKDKTPEERVSLRKIISISTIIEPLEKIHIIVDDKEDNKILECVFEGKADYIISQDNHILKLKEFEGIKIFSPEEFFEILNKK